MHPKKYALLALLALIPLQVRAADQAAPAIAVPSSGPDAPASKATIEEMLTLTNAQGLIQNLMGQMNQMVAAATPKTVNGHALTPEERAQVEKAATRVINIYKDELSWDKLEPMYIEIYQRTFTEAELGGVVAFYKTPAGQAFLKKLPLVVQNTMVAMKGRMGPIMERISKEMAETKTEIQNADSAKPGPQG